MSTILDTCVVSELYGVKAEPAVVQRVNELGADAYLSVITIGEIFRGTQKLERGRRQRVLLDSLHHTEQRFARRILPIDTEIAASGAESPPRRQASEGRWARRMASSPPRPSTTGWPS